MSTQVPSLGRVVLVPMDPQKNNGADTAPAVIVRVWNDTTVNVQVLPDSGATVGNWRTSVTYTTDPADAVAQGNRHVWYWPPRV